ncbi:MULTISPECIES: S8 family peptidase [unclassified Streptomyces]|uniref:S8 family peptidase n=1 Tax=unclassified Streptomyces TaxID=2593676 RepID=UPI002E2E36F9|nr:S8 family serine peptidase [Streptomyces sp. NBC_00223]
MTGTADAARTAQARTGTSLTWSLLTQERGTAEVPAAWGGEVTPEWAWGGSTGRGVRVCVVDSGVEAEHPMIGPVDGSWVVAPVNGSIRVTETAPVDVCGHGSACAGIIRSLAPECEIHSVRVLGESFGGTGDVFVAGLRWAVEQGFDVINLSLSTSRPKFTAPLREVADDAFFRRSVIVASAHNMRVESFPWRFSSVISVGSHDVDDPDLVLYNPSPPVEFFAQGQNVEVAWLGGARTRNTGNSFATPRISGLCALILAKHPRVTAFQLKNILYLTAANVRGES